MSFVPYCGNAPTPGAVAWNLDPILIAALTTCGVACARWGRHGRPLASYQLALFCAGWSTLGLALISPLCNLSVALFSARVGQHVVLTLVAAPLIAAGLAFRRDRTASGFELWSVCGVFACVLWFWHSPGPYDASLQNNYVYWMMQIIDHRLGHRALASAGSVRPTHRLPGGDGDGGADVAPRRRADIRTRPLVLGSRTHDGPVGL